MYNINIGSAPVVKMFKDVFMGNMLMRQYINPIGRKASYWGTVETKDLFDKKKRICCHTSNISNRIVHTCQRNLWHPSKGVGGGLLLWRSDYHSQSWHHQEVRLNLKENKWCASVAGLRKKWMDDGWMVTETLRHNMQISYYLLTVHKLCIKLHMKTTQRVNL